jgi:hypothetical protein
MKNLRILEHDYPVACKFSGQEYHEGEVMAVGLIKRGD